MIVGNRVLIPPLCDYRLYLEGDGSWPQERARPVKQQSRDVRRRESSLEVIKDDEGRKGSLEAAEDQRGRSTTLPSLSS